MSSRDKLVDITSAAINSPDLTVFQGARAIRPSNINVCFQDSPNSNPPYSPHFMMATSASRAQQQPANNPQLRPITPLALKPAGSKRKASTFIASASKILKPNSSKASKFANVDMRSQSASPGLLAVPNNCHNPAPSHLPIKRSPYVPLAPSSFPTRPSPLPPDKPLPSLPVATIVTKSPIQRRSLIDAAERPLRRSISPQARQGGEEDWPSLSPERPAAARAPSSPQIQKIVTESATLKLPNGVSQDPAIWSLEGRQHHKSASKMTEHPLPIARQSSHLLLRPVIPSVGESVIEGLQKLNLQDAGVSQNHDSDSNKENVLGANEVSEAITPAVFDFPNLPVPSPYHKPAGCRGQGQKTAPFIRQTKTSAMRMRHSTGSINNSDHLIEKQTKIKGSKMGSQKGTQIVRQGDPVNPTVPVRSKSRLRHMATGRGSPYTVPARSASRSSDHLRPFHTPNTPATTSEGPRSASLDSNSSLPPAKTADSSASAKRKTSIPLPSRLIRHFPTGESEAEIPEVKHRRGSIRSPQSQANPSDADVDTDRLPRASYVHRHPTPLASAPLKKPSSSKLLTFSELMATPAPTEGDLNSDNESVQDSLHGCDENGGFKIKKLRGRALQGATLRISDSAKKLLAPEENDCNNAWEANERRSSVLLRDHLRKSSDLIKSQIQLTRSITERSLARLSSAPTAETKVSGDDNHASGDGDPSVVIKHKASVESQVEKSSVGGGQEKPEAVDTNDAVAAGTPSSNGRGDWPLKDFKTLAQASREHSARESIDSSWIPPPDWEVRKSPDLSTLDFSSPPVQVPRYISVKPSTTRNHFSSPVPPLRRPPPPPAESDGDDDAPPPTPEKDSIFKRKFPPRTTSKQKVPQFVLNDRDRNLSPVREMSEYNLAAHLQRKGYGPTPSKIAQPKYVRSFTQSIRDINDGFNAVKKPTLPSRDKTPPTISKTSGKKTMSFRSLFRKKSGEIKGSFRVKGTRPTIETSQISSPLLATPTPVANEIHTRDFASPSDIPEPTTSARAETSMPPNVAALLGRQIPPSCASTKMDVHQIESLEIRHGTQTAFRLLEMARDERPGPRQNQLVELGKATIQVINGARDAEKTLEQARAAVTRTEMYALACKKAVADVTAMVGKLLGDKPSD